jgi:hypothetical protein
MKQFNKLLLRIKQYELLQLFTIYLRYLIGSAFVFAAFGMGKIIPFFDKSVIGQGDPNSPITHAFSSFIHSELYWSFIGWSQLIAGILLVTQRFARFGIMIYLPIIANIFMLTYSYHFQGTDIVTGLMLLAALYLALWEGDKLQYLFIEPTTDNLTLAKPTIERLPIWGYAGVGMVALLATTFHYIPLFYNFLTCLLFGIVALLIYVSRFRNHFLGKLAYKKQSI